MPAQFFTVPNHHKPPSSSQVPKKKQKKKYSNSKSQRPPRGHKILHVHRLWSVWPWDTPGRPSCSSRQPHWRRPRAGPRSQNGDQRLRLIGEKTMGKKRSEHPQTRRFSSLELGYLEVQKNGYLTGILSRLNGVYTSMIMELYPFVTSGAPPNRKQMSYFDGQSWDVLGKVPCVFCWETKIVLIFLQTLIWSL